MCYQQWPDGKEVRVFTKGEVDALVERALREGRLQASGVGRFREALEKGHLPFFTEAEVDVAVANEEIPAGMADGLKEVVARPDIAMYNPDWEKQQRQLEMLCGLRRRRTDIRPMEPRH